MEEIKIFIIIYILCFNLSTSKLISNRLEQNSLCSLSTYDNASVTKECKNGPKKDKRILQYQTFSQYISSNDYKANGLPFYTSFFVDTDLHNFWEFMDGGMYIIIMLIITIIFIIAWIPLIFCWYYKCCLFDDCLTNHKCCFVFWHVLTYTLFAAILSFIIVCIIFSE